MNELFLVLIAGLIVAGVGLPFVEAYSRWKKEMECDEDVQD